MFHAYSRFLLVFIFIAIGGSCFADDGVSNRTLAPMAAPLPVTTPAPGPMPEDKQLSPPARKALTKEKTALPLDPQTQDAQAELHRVEERLKAGGLTDKERFDLQLKRNQLQKKLGVHS